ncbi:MAG: hypothetical protein KF802_06190 [Bdellovibrionaceae bacterium]|nr:hypothetical protein [Pseudobdellovibrionaceae bacterium]MBX3032511.1 hypothetical protein [Pseudobdellovibrionaceae bacterium]
MATISKKNWTRWSDHDIATESSRKDAKSEDTILVAFWRMVGLLALGMILLVLTMQFLGQMPVRSTVERGGFMNYFSPPAATTTAPDPEITPAQEQRSVQPAPELQPQPVQ